MGGPLASIEDVTLMYTPLAGADQPTLDQITGLIQKASAILRQRIPWVDDRIARFGIDPTDVGGLDPVLVADVVATMIKRFLVNQSGATNQSETVGPYSHSTGFVIRGEKNIVLGELFLSDSDIDKLRGPIKLSPKIGTARMGSTLNRVVHGYYDGDVWAPGMGDYIPDQGWINAPDGTP
jgi:hypothetical protein